LGSLAVGRELRELDHVADAIDEDRIDRLHVAFLVALDRLDPPQVGMSAGSVVAATRAMTARSACARLLAQQRLRKVQRESAFANAPPAGNEQRMRPARALCQRLPGNRLLPGQQRLPASRIVRARFAHFGFIALARMVSSSARTSAFGRVVSTTRMRAGSARARSR